MKTRLRPLSVVLVASCFLVLPLSVAAQILFEWDSAEECENLTGQIATDLHKVIRGEFEIVAAQHDEFSQHVWWNADDRTYITWFDGSVAPGQSTWASFHTGYE